MYDLQVRGSDDRRIDDDEDPDAQEYKRNEALCDEYDQRISELHRAAAEGKAIVVAKDEDGVYQLAAA